MKRAVFLSLVGICLIVGLYAGAALAYTPPSLPPPTKNVYELIALNKKLGKFADMIEEAGLKDMVSATGGEMITVFAPTDEALDDIPRDTMRRIEASTASLQSFVKYHIIAGSTVSANSMRGRKMALASANGEPLTFDGTDRAKPPKIEGGTFMQTDILATNGVLHIANTPLVPPSLAQPPAPPPVIKQPAPPVAPTPPVAAAPAQTGTAAAATAPGGKVHITTSGVAKAPAAAMTTSSEALPGVAGMAPIPPSADEETTTAAPATTTGSSRGFELFGHKFSW